MKYLVITFYVFLFLVAATSTGTKEHQQKEGESSKGGNSKEKEVPSGANAVPTSPLRDMVLTMNEQLEHLFEHLQDLSSSLSAHYSPRSSALRHLLDWNTDPTSRSLAAASAPSMVQPRGESSSFVVQWHPTADLSETKDALVIRAELPGVKEDKVSLDLVDGFLVLRGEKCEEKEEEDKERKWHRRERSFGSFQRAFRLPEGVKMEDIQATFNNGVLEVHIPKPVQAQKTNNRIPIAFTTSSSSSPNSRPS